MSVFVTYPRAGDGNLASDQGSGATPAGWRHQNQEVPTAIGGSGEWEAGRRRRT